MPSKVTLQTSAGNCDILAMSLICRECAIGCVIDYQFQSAECPVYDGSLADSVSPDLADLLKSGYSGQAVRLGVPRAATVPEAASLTEIHLSTDCGPS